MHRSHWEKMESQAIPAQTTKSLGLRERGEPKTKFMIVIPQRLLRQVGR